MKKVLFIAITVILSAVIIYFLVVTKYTYSEGNRAGWIMKFSKKGYVFKTYEGELNQSTSTGMPINNTPWYFSVKDETVAQKLMAMEGKRVSLHYKQKLRTLPWIGDSEYIVDNAEEIK